MDYRAEGIDAFLVFFADIKGDVHGALYPEAEAALFAIMIFNPFLAVFILFLIFSYGHGNLPEDIFHRKTGGIDKKGIASFSKRGQVLPESLESRPMISIRICSSLTSKPFDRSSSVRLLVRSSTDASR